jgi:hypothetical protein
MARRPEAPPERKQRKTALLVGEGLAEQAFLNHLKGLYVERGSKQVSVKTAKGKGGAHVLDYTRRQGLQADFDQMGTLLDTDTDWSDEQRKMAIALDIEVFEATPCLEALLLRVATLKAAPHTTDQCKKAFKQKFQAEAHAQGLFERHFLKDVLEQARKQVPELERLVGFLLR